jgi:hypothetical protein
LPTDEVRNRFGNPARYVLSDGSISPQWEAAILTYVPFPEPLPMRLDSGMFVVKRARVHRLVAPLLAQALAQIHDEGLWSLLHDYAGGYVWRAQRKAPSVLSRHAWGIAVDFNSTENPFGVTPRMDARIVDAFDRNGFAWGGNWLTRKDGMHFEFARVELLDATGGSG